MSGVYDFTRMLAREGTRPHLSGREEVRFYRAFQSTLYSIRWASVMKARRFCIAVGMIATLLGPALSISIPFHVSH